MHKASTIKKCFSQFGVKELDWSDVNPIKNLWDELECQLLQCLGGLNPRRMSGSYSNTALTKPFLYNPWNSNGIRTDTRVNFSSKASLYIYHTGSHIYTYPVPLLHLSTVCAESSCYSTLKLFCHFVPSQSPHITLIHSHSRICKFQKDKFKDFLDLLVFLRISFQDHFDNRNKGTELAWADYETLDMKHWAISLHFSTMKISLFFIWFTYYINLILY